MKRRSKDRVQELIAQIRAGADFKALAAANSEREKNGKRHRAGGLGFVGEFDLPSCVRIWSGLEGRESRWVCEPIKL
jgi:hypothetical protein